MTEERKSEHTDEQVEDLDVAESEAAEVKGGRKAGKGQQEYLVIKLSDVQVSSFQSGGSEGSNA
jgi:hypothetical protein